MTETIKIEIRNITASNAFYDTRDAVNKLLNQYGLSIEIINSSDYDYEEIYLLDSNEYELEEGVESLNNSEANMEK